MSHFICIAKFTSKPGKEEELLHALSTLIEPTKAEKGCIRYELNRSIHEPLIFTMVEIFKSKKDFDVHSSQSYLADFRNSAKAFIDAIDITLGFESQDA